MMYQRCFPEACNFIKKETLAHMFSCEFYEFLRTPFLQNTSRQLLLNKEGFLNQHLIKVSKLLVFVLFFFSLFQVIWSKHFFKNNSALFNS